MIPAKRIVATQAVPNMPRLTMERRKTLFASAVMAHRSNRTREAEKLYREILDSAPDHAATWSNLGLALLARSAFAKAAVAYRRAIELNPGDADAHLNLIVALEGCGQVEAAMPIYQAAFRLLPERADLRCNLGIVVEGLGRIDEAEALYQEAAALDPSSAIYPFHQGRALIALGRTEAAIEVYRATLAIDPGQVVVLSSLGTALVSLNRYEEAAAASRRAHELMPDNALVANNHAVVLHQQGRVAEAAQIYRAAIAIDPGYHSAWANLGVACQELFRFDDALCGARTGRRAASRPSREPCRTDQDPAAYLRLEPLCRGSRTASEARGRPNDASSMLLLMAFPSTAKQQLTCARHQMARINASRPASTTPPIGRSGHASASAIFRQTTATIRSAACCPRCWPSTIGGVSRFSAMPSASTIQDGFVDASHEPAITSSTFITSRTRTPLGGSVPTASHVLVDLTGPMIGARMEILARRPAPIQVSFLGWPGTTGADCIDYVIGDPLLTPAHHQTHYAEKIVQMPICYQPSDPYRASSKPNLTRAECGLPDDAFVFCSFNNTSKLTPEVFDLWLRLLAQTRNSVLWLYSKTPKNER